MGVGVALALGTRVVDAGLGLPEEAAARAAVRDARLLGRLREAGAWRVARGGGGVAWARDTPPSLRVEATAAGRGRCVGDARDTGDCAVPPGEGDGRVGGCIGG